MYAAGCCTNRNDSGGVNLHNGFIHQDAKKTICPTICGTFCPVPVIWIGQTVSAQLEFPREFLPEISQTVPA